MWKSIFKAQGSTTEDSLSLSLQLQCCAVFVIYFPCIFVPHFDLIIRQNKDEYRGEVSMLLDGGTRHTRICSQSEYCWEKRLATAAHNKDNLLFRRRLQRLPLESLSCIADQRRDRLIVLRISRPAIMARPVTRLRDPGSPPYDDRQPPGSMAPPPRPVGPYR